MAITCAITAAFWGAAPVAAQDAATEVRKTVDSAIGTEQKTQQQLDDWHAERATLTVRYETAKAQVAFLRQVSGIEEQEVLALEAAIAELERRLTESGRLMSVLGDSLNTVVYRLDEWVNQDLPFLAEERTARVKGLRTDMASPGLTGAEKLRRVLEALQVEANYGATMEVNQSRIQIGEELLTVDVLRVGRVSVFWRTPDGKRVGEFDRASEEWVELPSKYSRRIGDAMEMASRMRPVEIISLPIGRIVP